MALNRTGSVDSTAIHTCTKGKNEINKCLCINNYSELANTST